MFDVPSANPITSASLPDAHFEFLTGFEGTHIFGSGSDVLETTEHTTRFPDDLRRLARDGLKSFRACIPWHRIEGERGVYDWRWTDAYLALARDLGLDPIADPLHHTSFPDWLTGGAFGPEDSVITIGIVVACLSALFYWARRRNRIVTLAKS